ncbi:hypothetical protein NDU88_002252 [Pleurodeles waltl]|uniref:Uncharacterized protein n=1 Tax=Pleurodeles waltl TaxID=8319 RepID=A0AAV7ND49_PLEWA|nr:hypothetical protein NDU88_002252 [Pleurodeles waltl]
MATDDWVQAALRLLKEAGRLDLVHKGVLEPLRQAQRAASRVEVAVLACSPPRVVRAGRTFCRRLGMALSGQWLPHHHVRLRVGVKEDFRMWGVFLEQFNGIPLQTW